MFFIMLSRNFTALYFTTWCKIYTFAKIIK